MIYFRPSGQKHKKITQHDKSSKIIFFVQALVLLSSCLRSACHTKRKRADDSKGSQIDEWKLAVNEILNEDIIAKMTCLEK